MIKFTCTDNQPLGDKLRLKTHKRLKERFAIGRNRPKRANFRGSPLFQATGNIKTEKQTINQLIVCQLYVGGWRKASLDWFRIIIKPKSAVAY